MEEQPTLHTNWGKPMETSQKPRSRPPVLTLLLAVVMGAVLVTASKYFFPDEASAHDPLVDLMVQKLVGKWEQKVKESYIDMELLPDGSCSYALREAGRLDIVGKWALKEGRLILHIDKVNAGSNFRVGEDVTLGPVISVDSRLLMLGSEENKTIFRRRP